MIVVGLTGSIAMGKSTVAAMFVEFGFPVFDADAAVHDFYQSEGAGIIESMFPGSVVDGVVNRERLAARALGDADAMRRLEGVVHPAVALRQNGFLNRARDLGRRLVFLDIPLLLEKGGDRGVDLVLVISASCEAQRERALARGGMTLSKFNSVIARQTADIEKRRRAHFVIDTNGPLADSRAQALCFVRAVAGMPGGGVRHA